MDKARADLIGTLISYKKVSSHDITVVFDGYKGGSGIENSEFRGGVKIIYSRLGQKADDVIKRIISTERRQWIVVSSDRDIMNHAWANDSVPIPSEIFFDIIEKRARQRKTTPDRAIHESSDDIENHITGSEGNPKRLSKKERTLRRVLNKL